MVIAVQILQERLRKYIYLRAGYDARLFGIRHVGIDISKFHQKSIRFIEALFFADKYRHFTRKHFNKMLWFKTLYNSNLSGFSLKMVSYREKKKKLFWCINWPPGVVFSLKVYFLCFSSPSSFIIGEIWARKNTRTSDF